MIISTLTPQQKRLWIEWKLDPNGHYYNVNVQFKLIGSLDIERFTSAIKQAANYFESFRTYFIEENASPKQCILSETNVALEFIDISESNDSEHIKDILARDLFKQKIREPINLKNYPIMRFCIIRICENLDYFMMINAHILSDATSAQFILEAISAIYNNNDKIIDLYKNNSRLRVDDYLNGDTLKTHNDLGYWTQNLAGSPLSVKVGAGQAKTRKGRRHYFALDEQEFKDLKVLARRDGATIFTYLAAAYGVFLSRYFEQNDIVFTYPVNIRGNEFPKIYGFYVSNIPLRIKLEKNVSFSDVVRQVTSQRRADRENERCSLDEIIRALRSSHGALPDFPFNVSFGQTFLSLQSLSLNDVQTEVIVCDPSETYSDLSLQYDASTNILRFYWEYKTELFSDIDLENLTESFLTFLREVIKAPEILINDTPILSLSQKETILTKARSSTLSSKPYDPNSGQFSYSITRPIEVMAICYPENIALKTEERALTYAEFNAKVNRFAHYLLSKGLHRGDHIAVCLERSEELIIILAAILKIGAAYLPIDPKYPQQRANEIIGDCSPALIVTNGKNINKLVEAPYPVCCIDNPEASLEIGGCISDNLDIELSGSETAYIIYTSGSSGKPKGVMISHSNVNSRFYGLQSIVGLTHTDKAIQTINYCFDPSVFEIFWPLTVGATLVLPKPDINQDPESLIRIINEENITFFSSVPSLLRIFMQKVRFGECSSLRNVLCGGEILPSSLAKQFLQVTPARLFNAYGPTEATILACYHECKKEDSQILPIGRPLENGAIYILNNNLELQPDGAVGEICIGGCGIGKGYLNQPELTREKFIDDPFAQNGKSILYKTGDLGRYLPSGEIEFIGRKDRQVKIRGFRIELGEIEHAIANITSINHAAVLCRQSAQGNKIIGYYSPNLITPEEVRNKLESVLPEHMIPSHLIGMANMPINANGKLDETSLPEPETVQIILQNKRQPNEVEKKLREIFAQLTERQAEAIGLDEKFFDAGGDSLKAIEMAIIIEEKFGIKLPDTIVFEYPTISLLARLLQPKNFHHTNTEISLSQRLVGRQDMRNRRIRSNSMEKHV